MAWSFALRGIVSGMALCSAASRVLADPLAAGSLPAATRWVMHVNVDAARDARPLWNLARARAFTPLSADLLPKIAMFEQISGMKLPQDLHDVSLYGAAFDQSAVCLRIHGNMDKNSIISFLRSDPEFKLDERNGHTILSWRDKTADRKMYASFVKTDLVILSANAQALAESIDTLDGKADALKAGSPLMPPPAADGIGTVVPMVWIAAENLSELALSQKPESPLLSQMEAASISLQWLNDKPSAEVRVLAKSDAVARQMQSVAEGVKAMVALAAADGNAQPHTRQIDAVLQRLATDVNGKLVTATLSLDVQTLDALAAEIPGKAGEIPAIKH